MSVTSWLALTQHKSNDQAISTAIQAIASSIGNETSVLLKGNITAIQRMAERRRDSPDISQDIWRHDAIGYMEDMDLLAAISWVSPDYKVRWIEPLKGNEAALNLDLMFAESRSQPILLSVRNQTPHVTQIIMLKTGNLGFLVFAPIGLHQTFNGLISGVFHIDGLLTSPAFKAAEKDFNITLIENDETLYPATTAPIENPALSFSASIDIPDRNWKIIASPTHSYLAKQSSNLASIIIGLGLLMTLLVSRLIYMSYSLQDQITAATIAASANKAKSIFLANMSHELRTPLNAIIGFSDIMASNIFGPLGSEKYEEYSKDINASGKYLLQHINDILDLSTIEAGERLLTMEQANLRHLIENSWVVVKDSAEVKGINFTIDVANDAPLITCDKRALKQIMINLLNNAVKYTPHNGKVSIKARATDTDYVLEFIDTGKGIPEEEIKYLTDPFFMVQDDPYKTEEGTGLGLSIVNSLLELQDGTLDISSVVGEGTTVKISLPRLD